MANVSDEEAGILVSAAERATARRRRPVSVDSPGPAANINLDRIAVPNRTFNFSTPSRFGISKSTLRDAARSSPVYQIPVLEPEKVRHEEQEEPQEEEEEETLSYEVEPAPIPPRLELDAGPAFCVRSPSASSSTSSTDPTSPRRKVANQNLKAYADGLLMFTQSRLNTVAPQTIYMIGEPSDSSVPPTPELEQDVMELRFERPPLRSHFSNWSTTTETTVDEDTQSRLSYASSIEPRTPDMESGMISPDSFFNDMESTPRVRQHSTAWNYISSARPSSQPFDSPVRHSDTSNASANPNSESFSYFTGFDSVSAVASSQYSSRDSPLDFEVLRTPDTPSDIPSRSRPVSSASNSMPFAHRRPHTPFGEGMGISRPPSWLVRAVH